MKSSNLQRLLNNEIKLILYRTNKEGLRDEIPDALISDAVILSGSFNPLH